MATRDTLSAPFLAPSAAGAGHVALLALAVRIGVALKQALDEFNQVHSRAGK